MQPPWIWLPIVGPIRISTVCAGLLMVVVIAWRRRDPLSALIALMAWASAYEILYSGTGTVLHAWSVSGFAWMTAAVGGWVVLSLVRGIVPDWRLLLAMALVWGIWIVTGFNSNAPSVGGTPGFPKEFSVANEVLNELTKSLLALAYLLGALNARVPKPPAASAAGAR